MDFEASPLIETAMTSGSVGGGVVSAGPAAGQPLHWQVARDSQSRWTKAGFLKVKPRHKKRTAKDDERDRRKWLKQFSMLSLYRRENFLSGLTELTSPRPSGSHHTPTAGLDNIVSPSPRGHHRPPASGDPENVVLPITNKGNTKPEDMFLTDKEKRGSHLRKKDESFPFEDLRSYFSSLLGESFLDRLPHAGTDIEDLDDDQWKDIQAKQNKSTDDPMWVWKRRLRYAGAMKNYKEGENVSFEPSPLV